MENSADKSVPEIQPSSELELAIAQAEAEAGSERQDNVGGVQRYEPRFDPFGAMSCRSISEMDDDQLEHYIGTYQEIVHQAEQGLESKRAKLIASKLERSERRARRFKASNVDLDLTQAVDLAYQDAQRKAVEAAKTPTTIEAWLKKRDGKP